MKLTTYEQEMLEGFDDKWFRDSVDYAVLGYLVGEIVVNRVPVIDGLPEWTMPDHLKALSAAAASGGAVGMFHVVDQTPEAPTVEAAFGSKTGYETIVITPDEMKTMEDKLNTMTGESVEMVLIGCPHCLCLHMQRA